MSWLSAVIKIWITTIITKYCKRDNVESDFNTTEITVDDTNKINDAEKRTKENQTGKLVVNNKKKKVFVLGDSIAKYIQSWEITKKGFSETVSWLKS